MSDRGRGLRDWPLLRLSFLLREIDERAGAGGDSLPLLSVSIHRGVMPRSELTDRESRADDFALYKRVANGDVVINRMRAFEGGAGISPVDGMVSSDYAVLRTGPRLDARFFHHLIRSKWFVGEMTARLRGIGNVDAGNVRTPRINVADLRDIRIALPGLDEQKAIAHFLDHQVSRLDQLIDATIRELAVSEERLRASITSLIWGQRKVGHAVPARRVRLHAAVNPETRDHRRLRDDDQVTFLPLEAVWPRDQLDVSRVRSWAEVRTGFTRFLEGDVLLPKITPTFQAGRAAVARGLTGGIGAGTTELHILRPGQDLSPEFLAYVLNSTPFLQAGEAAMYGVAGQRRVPDEVVRDFRLPVPSLPEQREMVEELDLRSVHAKRVRALLERRASTLRERRQALISAAVTGELHGSGGVAA